MRSIIRKALLIDQSKKENSVKIMMDGSDWVGMAQQLTPALGHLGYAINDLPIRFFSPLIEDWAGSKFSKSTYVNNETYLEIHPALRDYEMLKKTLGNKGIDLIWNETSEWIADSKKFFRNYTTDYFVQKWKL